MGPHHILPNVREGPSKTPFNSGLYPLSLANLRTGMRCYINRAKIKLKKLTGRKLCFMPTLGKRMSISFFLDQVCPSRRERERSCHVSCPDSTDRKSPDNQGCPGKQWQLRWRRWLAFVEGRTIGPRRELPGRSPQSPFQETGHFEHLLKPS